MEFSKGDYGNFFERIGNSLPIRRAYRIWMSEKLHSKSDSLSTFISYVMEMPDNYWKNETIIAVMLSPYASVFFEIYSSSFLEDNHQLLLKIANLLLIGCRSYNEKIKNDPQALVAQYEEAIKLRLAGIEGQVLMLSPVIDKKELKYFSTLF